MMPVMRADSLIVVFTLAGAAAAQPKQRSERARPEPSPGRLGPSRQRAAHTQSVGTGRSFRQWRADSELCYTAWPLDAVGGGYYLDERKVARINCDNK